MVNLNFCIFDLNHPVRIIFAGKRQVYLYLGKHRETEFIAFAAWTNI